MPNECKHCGAKLSDYRDFCDQFCRKAYAEDNGDSWEELYAPVILKGHHLQMMKRTLDAMSELVVPYCLTITVTSDADYIIIKIKDIENLSIARDFIKRANPHWRDKLSLIWHSCGSALASWKDENIPVVVIWLETTIEAFPKSLGSNENCGWQKVTEERYTYTCGAN